MPPPPRNLLESMGNVGNKLGGDLHQQQAGGMKHQRHGGLPRLSASSKALALLPLLLLAFIFLFVYPKEFDLQAAMLSASCGPPAARPLLEEAAAEPAAVVRRKPDFRLLIGVLTRADLYERRHLLRMVYGLQLASGDLAAHVDVRYVLCRLYKDDQRVLVPLEIMAHGDVIVLDGCEENLNGGKTYTFLSAVAGLYGADDPYDYVMKADDDIFLRLPQLVASLGGMPREDMYYGATIPCDSMDPFQEYMAGMAYALSWDLVEWIAVSDVARNNSVGTEDMLTGMWLRIAGKGKNRFNAKPAIHDYLNPVPVDQCEHAFMPGTIGVHRLKSNPRWAEALDYFNFTAGLQPSKFFNFTTTRHV